MKRTYTKTTSLLAVAFLGLASATGCSIQPSVNAAGSTPSVVVESTPPLKPVRRSIYVPASPRGPAVNVPRPVAPERINEATPEGLKAFSEFWYKTLDFMYKTGETGPFLALCSGEKEHWRVFAEGMAKIYADGGWVVGGLSEARAGQVARESEEDQLYQALVDARYSAFKTYKPDGSTVEGGGGGQRVSELLTVKYVNDSWHVLEMRRVGIGKESSFYDGKSAGFTP